MTGKGALNVIIVADNDAIRSGLKMAVERLDGFCVSDAGTPMDAAGIARRLDPDVAIIETGLRTGPDIAACRQIREASPGCRLIVLSSYVNEQELVASLLAGASACVLKQVGGRSGLAETIRRVQAGEDLLRTQLGAYLERLLDPDASPLDAADRQLLAMLAARLTDIQIAKALDTGVEFVGLLIERLRERLNLRR